MNSVSDTSSQPSSGSKQIGSSSGVGGRPLQMCLCEHEYYKLLGGLLRRQPRRTSIYMAEFRDESRYGFSQERRVEISSVVVLSWNTQCGRIHH